MNLTKEEILKAVEEFLSKKRGIPTRVIGFRSDFIIPKVVYFYYEDKQKVPEPPAAREFTRTALDRHLPREIHDEPLTKTKGDPGYANDDHPADYGGLD